MKEVVRQLRLRDIGGIIVIDFIDMANPKNRATVEEALRSELERDRTKTYVVEISPLGLVEMTRQNVTDGPREVMTRKCPTCGGDGIVYSEASAAIDVERRLRALAAGSRAQAFRVELADPIASALVGPGARRLLEFEALTKKRFFLEGKPEMHLDHFVVLSEGKLADLAPPAPVGEDAEVMLQLVEVDRYDGAAAVGKLDGLDVVVAEAASQVGKRVKVRIERVLDGRAYAVAIRKTKAVPEPLTAEGEAEKPTRKPPARKGAAVAKEADAAVEEAVVAEEPEAETDGEAEETPDAGSRGGPEAEEEDTARLAWRPQAEEDACDGRNGRDRGRRCLGGSAGAGSRRHDPRARRGARPRRQGRAGGRGARRARARGDGRADDRRGGAKRPRRSWMSPAAPRRLRRRRLRPTRKRRSRRRRHGAARAAARTARRSRPPPPRTAPRRPPTPSPLQRPSPPRRTAISSYVPMSEWVDELESKG